MSSQEDGAPPPSKKVKFSPQVAVSTIHASPARDAITFHLLLSRSRTELEAELASGGLPFTAEYFNQVFGEDEEILGYAGLEVHVWLAATTGHAWVTQRADEVRPGADDVLGLLRAWWPRPFFTEREAFLAAVADAPEPDWGTLGTRLPDDIVARTLTTAAAAAAGSGGQQQQLTLYHAQLAATPDWFKDLHARLEPLLIFTIDGANFLEADDDKWEVVAAVERGDDGSQHLAGYLALYNFYAWPLSHRPRVAQVLVLPPLQGRGTGRCLLAAAYALAVQRDAIDLTFEDPSPGLQLIREKLELDMLSAQPWAVQGARSALAAAAARQQQQQQGEQQQQQGSADGAGPSSPSGLLALPPELQARATKELKIHRHQVALVWEALLYLLAPLPAADGSLGDTAGWDAAAAAAAGGGALPPAAAAGALLAEPLAELVLARLERGAGGGAERHAGRKKLVQVEGAKDDWFVYRPRQTKQQGAGGEGGGQTEGEAADADEPNTLAVGRRAVAQVDAEEHVERLQAAAAERLEQLAVLKQRSLASQAAVASGGGAQA